MNVWDWCRLVKKKLVSVNIHSITDFLRKSHKYNIVIGRNGQICLEYATMDSFLSIIAKYVVFKRETIQSYWEHVDAGNNSDEEEEDDDSDDTSDSSDHKQTAKDTNSVETC